jgi:hypothetical protein
MKLEIILDQLNAFEKNSFLKILSNIIERSPKKAREIDKILQTDKDLRNVDNINIAKVFGLLEEEFVDYVKTELLDASTQFDIIIDILIRDGNCIMTRERFNKLFENETKILKSKIRNFEKEVKDEISEIPEHRKRDYKIYKECFRIAFTNDLDNNQDCKITTDEQTILNTLSKNLGLSQEEIKLSKYSIIEIKSFDLETSINNLKNIGTIFYSRKTLKIYVADEIVRALRKVRGKEVADKYIIRVLKRLPEPQINQIAKNHNIDWKAPIEEKIKNIIKEGISIQDILSEDIFREGTMILEKKSFINEFIEKELNISQLGGATIEEKLYNLIDYFDQIDKDEKIGISLDGYNKLLSDLDHNYHKFRKLILDKFELQEGAEEIFKGDYLLDYNIKPIDILDIIPEQNLRNFCEKISIKTRGNLILNIIEYYKDVDDLNIENYSAIASRDLNKLKENGINIKENDLGVKFEEITKSIFQKLGFNVDDKLRKSINSPKDKIDIVLNLSNNRLIIIECKTIKEAGYNKYSSVSRQIKSYVKHAESKGFQVIKPLLIAPDFSEEFEKECREEYELNLSLITADTLVNILKGFKDTNLTELPYQLLMKDVLIKDEWILKAINK